MSEGQIPDFPIPREKTISDAREALKPTYEPSTTGFSPDLFQLFFTLVRFHLPVYDLSKSVQFSPALEVVGATSDHEGSPHVMLEHIGRKFLIECQQQLLALTTKPILSRIGMLHGELTLAAQFITPQAMTQALSELCQLLTAETHDLFGSEVARMVTEEYWKKEKAADEVINDFLKKEIEKIRMLNAHSLEILSQTTIRRAVEGAPTGMGPKVLSWAKDNGIALE